MTTGVATFARVRNGKLEPFQATPKSQTQELRALCGVRDTLAEVLALQATSTDDGAFRDAQGRLNRRYDDYVSRYGPISRFSSLRDRKSGLRDRRGHRRTPEPQTRRVPL